MNISLVAITNHVQYVTIVFIVFIVILAMGLMVVNMVVTRFAMLKLSSIRISTAGRRDRLRLRTLKLASARNTAVVALSFVQLRGLGGDLGMEFRATPSPDVWPLPGDPRVDLLRAPSSADPWTVPKAHHAEDTTSLLQLVHRVEERGREAHPAVGHDGREKPARTPPHIVRLQSSQLVDLAIPGGSLLLAGFACVCGSAPHMGRLPGSGRPNAGSEGREHVHPEI